MLASTCSTTEAAFALCSVIAQTGAIIAYRERRPIVQRRDSVSIIRVGGSLGWKSHRSSSSALGLARQSRRNQSVAHC